MHKLNGAGLPNVYLRDGVTLTTDQEGDETVAYKNIDGLYFAIARAIALKAGSVSGAELRFLRKRLSWSQKQLAALGAKNEQAAAKWEKGTLPVSKAEATLLGICWLTKFSPNDVERVAKQIESGQVTEDQHPLVFSYQNGNWIQDDAQAKVFADSQASASADAAIRSAMRSAQFEVYATANGSGDSLRQALRHVVTTDRAET